MYPRPNSNEGSTMNRRCHRPPPQSCDTFVIVGDDDGTPTIFGKNSDRPDDEAHEVIRFPRMEYKDDSVVKCQYIEIPQVSKTHAVILSRPTWLWGAEMGANEYGVCVGNEAVSSRLEDDCDDGGRRLLGMDLVRLMLERSTTAQEALQVGTSLMEQFGQGGPCMDGGDWCYENSFLICDANEAYVLETAGKHYWAAEHIPKGTRRNISNGLSIRTPTSVHPQLLDFLHTKGWHKKDEEPLDWKKIMLGYSSSVGNENLQIYGREKAGFTWLAKMKQPSFQGMAECLRDTRSGICMQGGFESTGSQISILLQHANNDNNNIHWFTTGSDPSKISYKPFAFGANGSIGSYTNEEMATGKLWWSHKKTYRKTTREQLHQLETDLLAKYQQGNNIVTPGTFLEAIQQERTIVEGGA